MISFSGKKVVVGIICVSVVAIIIIPLLRVPLVTAAFGLPLHLLLHQQQQRYLSLYYATTTTTTTAASRYRTTTTTRLYEHTNDPKIEVHLPDDNNNNNNDDDDDDDDFMEPGMMRVSEIKAELQLRKVLYEDCFDKESLIQRLQQARATGQADPKILETFNKQKLEETFSGKKKSAKPARCR